LNTQTNTRATTSNVDKKFNMTGLKIEDGDAAQRMQRNFASQL